jgi:(1->4)-alpha-D-glucan 1-alpha-D-glucosylmutase
MASLRSFHERIAFYGAINSLSQTLLKMTCPGVPDFYQGATAWDFSLVDPDNRRPAQLPGGIESFEDIQDLLNNWHDGRVKSFLIYKTLHFRNANPNLFLMGEYLGLHASGLAADHSVTLARRRGDEWAVVVAPRFLTSLSALEKMPLGRRFWKDSALVLPGDAPIDWRNVLTNEIIRADEATGVQFSDILKSFPVALLTGKVTQ